MRVQHNKFVLGKLSFWKKYKNTVKKIFAKKYKIYNRAKAFSKLCVAYHQNPGFGLTSQKSVYLKGIKFSGYLLSELEKKKHLTGV